MKIVADSAIPFLQGVLEPWAEVRYLPGSRIAAEDVRDADALIIRTRTRCDGRLLAGSRVRLIATATIGFDHIDTAWCAAHGIRVATAAGCNARGVLQWAGAVLAHLARTQGWEPAQRTLGIVGVGHEGLLARLKPGAVVMNSSRGEVVDGDALLRSGHPCVLDVWEHEPRLDPQLLDRTLLATPHVAGYSEQGKATATAMSVATLAGFFGLPLRGWYPSEAAPSVPRPIPWQELCTTIGDAYDIEAESCRLKARPADFEAMRDHYRYRREYF